MLSSHRAHLNRISLQTARHVVWTVAALLMLTCPAKADDDKATRDDYALDTRGTSTTLKLNGEGRFSLVVTPKNGKKVHPDAPFEVVLKKVRGIKPGKTRLGRADVVDKAAASPEVHTTLRGEQAGTSTLEASVSFFLCTDAWCQRMTDTISVDVTVEQ